MNLSSRIEKRFYQALMLIALFGVPYLINHYAYLYVPIDASSTVELLYKFIAIVLGLVVSFMLLSSIEEEITNLRRKFGRKSLFEEETDLDNKKFESYLASEDKDTNSFLNMNSSQQNLKIYRLLKTNEKKLEKFQIKIEVIYIMLIVLVIMGFND